MSAAYLNDIAAQAAVGAITAQQVIAGLQAGTISADHAWLRFCELAAKGSWKAAQCRAFVCELAKRAGAR
jgi:uncharacterized protein (DUF1810 family)